MGKGLGKALLLIPCEGAPALACSASRKFLEVEHLAHFHFDAGALCLGGRGIGKGRVCKKLQHVIDGSFKDLP